MSEHTDDVAEPSTDYLRHSMRYNTNRFVESGTDVLANLEHIGAQLGCQTASWSWNTDYDYRDLTPRMPILSGHLYNRRPAAARQAAQQWANALGLTASRKAHRGTLAFEGEIDGLTVRIWTVVDRPAFDGKFTNLKRYAPDLILVGLLAASTVATGVLLARHNKMAHLLKAFAR